MLCLTFQGVWWVGVNTSTPGQSTTHMHTCPKWNLIGTDASSLLPPTRGRCSHSHFNFPAVSLSLTLTLTLRLKNISSTSLRLHLSRCRHGSGFSSLPLVASSCTASSSLCVFRKSAINAGQKDGWRFRAQWFSSSTILFSIYLKVFYLYPDVSLTLMQVWNRGAFQILLPLWKLIRAIGFWICLSM